MAVSLAQGRSKPYHMMKNVMALLLYYKEVVGFAEVCSHNPCRVLYHETQSRQQFLFISKNHS